MFYCLDLKNNNGMKWNMIEWISPHTTIYHQFCSSHFKNSKQNEMFISFRSIPFYFTLFYSVLFHYILSIWLEFDIRIICFHISHNFYDNDHKCCLLINCTIWFEAKIDSFKRLEDDEQLVMYLTIVSLLEHILYDMKT
jgi:hypothetical protein